MNLEILRPTYLFRHVEDIPLCWLQEQRIKHLLLDVDNTIASWDSEQIDPKVDAWLRAVLDAQIRIELLSNSPPGRLKRLAGQYGIGWTSWALKPFNRSFKKALRRLGCTDGKEALVVGDQMFTDVLGGNRLGIRTVLLTPRYDKDYIWTKLVRYAEQYFLEKLKINKKTCG